jgi:hypothetical protein
MGDGFLNTKSVGFLTDDSVVKVDVGYERMLFMHIARLSALSSYPGNEDCYFNAVKFLDAILEGEKDHQYMQDIAGLQKKFSMASAVDPASISPRENAQITNAFATQWFRVLMKLMKRKGFTPRIQTVDEIR